MWRLLSLPLPLLALTACQDTQARQQNAELQKRVDALEAQVKSLQARQVNAPTKTTVTDVTVKAAAQNCALELARTLETYRQDSLEHRYPTQTELFLPDACQHQKLAWQELKNQAYQFRVLGVSGEELAGLKSP